ncbi:ribonuclease III [Salinispirillum sp. LH 10-3-1]|uniref:Ribonuclease 3 n=1 Tax=Salinispirillum sp. LH 10-3-1 TaxID=2952525 RepID=A0AB38YDN2_9GAMM
MLEQDIVRLQQRLGYEFRDTAFLKLALTHRSVGAANNERLEFLGDAILNCTIAQALYERFPAANEGELSRFRAAMVKGDTLAELAREFDLGPFLKLGVGEMKSGGHQRSSILADSVEALIGAISLDADMATAQHRVLAWWQERLDQMDPDLVLKDPKTRLQEYLQSQNQPLPVYDVVAVTGQAHDQQFVVRCTTAVLPAPTEATDSSRRGAEQTAARAALKALGQKI